MAARNRWVRVVSVLVVIVGGAERSARADLIIGNLNSSYGGSVSVNNPHDYAMGFTIGSSSENVTSVQVVLTILSTSLSGLTLNIYNSSSNLPGSSVASFTDSGLSAGTQVVETFTGNVTLSASTEYWLVLGTTGNAFDWDYTHTTPLPNGATPMGPGATNNGAASYSGSSWSSGTILTSYELDSPITAPEPSTLVMVSSTMVFGLVVARRRRRRTEA